MRAVLSMVPDCALGVASDPGTEACVGALDFAGLVIADALAVTGLSAAVAVMAGFGRFG